MELVVKISKSNTLLKEIKDVSKSNDIKSFREVLKKVQEEVNTALTGIVEQEQQQGIGESVADIEDEDDEEEEEQDDTDVIKQSKRKKDSTNKQLKKMKL